MHELEEKEEVHDFGYDWLLGKAIKWEICLSDYFVMLYVLCFTFNDISK